LWDPHVIFLFPSPFHPSTSSLPSSLLSSPLPATANPSNSATPLPRLLRLADSCSVPRSQSPIVDRGLDACQQRHLAMSATVGLPPVPAGGGFPASSPA
jgi:hypothetical protein